MSDADLEIGLRWDRRQDTFYVSNRFAVTGENVDDWVSLDEPLSIDTQKLGRLIADERAYSTALTRMVLRPEDVEPFYRRVLARADGSGHKLHLRLHISASAPIRYHALRWELLCDPTTGSPIATRSNILLSRYLSSPDWRPIPAPDKHDLCALVVVAGPRDVEDYHVRGQQLGEVKVDEELARVQTALGGIPGIRSVRNLTGAATLTNITAALDQGVDNQAVDILYLVCHGALADDVPRLYLEKSDRTVDVVDGRRFVESLSELERRPMLIVLCSCQSASADAQMWSTADDGELSALGPRLASAGVTAVVAMQGNISMTTVKTFAPAFFTALAQHGVVDEAMAAARRAIRERPDWWVPVLFSRLRSGRTSYTPGFVEHGEATWDSLTLQVKDGFFTPVIGPMLASRILGSRQDIARAWAQRWQMPIASHNQGDLAQVAQYLRVRNTPGFVRARLRDHLMKEIRERQKGAPKDPIWDLPDALVRGSDPRPAIRAVGQRLRLFDKGDPYGILAKLDASLYVTTGWTDLLQDALQENGREPVTMMFPWNDQTEETSIRHDGRVPTVERPLVYHLYGRLDDLSSLVLTEDDYFVWLNAWATGRETVPPFVRKALTGASSMLFLGYRLDDWDFRVLFQGIKNLGGSGQLRDNQHVGVQLSRESHLIEPEAIQQYLEALLSEAKVSIYWGDTRQFLNNIQERIRRE